MAWLRAALWALTLLLPLASLGQDLLPVPALTGRVVDTIGLLDAPQRERLERELATLGREKGAQVVFLLVATTTPEDIASYANRVGNSWKIGRRDVGDGLLLVVARDDRKVRIEVAKTLEGAIPDLAAKGIIDEALTPAFRRGDYAGGLQAAADRIGALVRGEVLPEPARSARSPGNGMGADLEDLAIFLFIAVPVMAAALRRLFGRKVGALLAGSGAGLIAWLVTASVAIGAAAGLVGLALSLAGLSPLGRRGRHHAGGWPPAMGGDWRGGGGYGGGGFGSGGGGDFGGGGASGDW